jgi:pimeloyl-ACP methyl ester carboxylesterase
VGYGCIQEVSSILLDKLIAAGVGERPVVFVTHSMGGLVVKQMLLQAGQDAKCAHLVDQTSGIVWLQRPLFLPLLELGSVVPLMMSI